MFQIQESRKSQDIKTDKVFSRLHRNCHRPASQPFPTLEENADNKAKRLFNGQVSLQDHLSFSKPCVFLPRNDKTMAHI